MLRQWKCFLFRVFFLFIFIDFNFASQNMLLKFLNEKYDLKVKTIKLLEEHLHETLELLKNLRGHKNGLTIKIFHKQKYIKLSKFYLLKNTIKRENWGLPWWHSG